MSKQKKNLRAAALFTVISGLIYAGPTAAAETIRVAFAPDVPSVTITGSPDLVLITPDGGIVADGLTTAVEILPGSNGLSVQGSPIDATELIASSRGGDLHVNGLTFGGMLHVMLSRDGLRLINELGLEDYLKGVVPSELSPKWHPEALKAQAIIARTYALHQRQMNPGKAYDLLSTTADQVYGGRGKEDPASNQAVAETEGLVLTYEGELILSAYHSTSAGPTESASEVWGMDLPYLKGVSCPFDRNSPYFEWSKTLGMDAVQSSFSKAGTAVGAIASLTPFHFTEAGRVSEIRILHSQGELILKAADFRRILGYTELPSTRFRIDKIGREIRILGNGYGHGVGLCQWGAKEMAEMGYSYDKILKYYYPGIHVEPYSTLTTDGPNP